MGSASSASAAPVGALCRGEGPGFLGQNVIPDTKAREKAETAFAVKLFSQGKGTPPMDAFGLREIYCHCRAACAKLPKNSNDAALGAVVVKVAMDIFGAVNGQSDRISCAQAAQAALNGLPAPERSQLYVYPTRRYDANTGQVGWSDDVAWWRRCDCRKLPHPWCDAASANAAQHWIANYERNRQFMRELKKAGGYLSLAVAAMPWLQGALLQLEKHEAGHSELKKAVKAVLGTYFAVALYHGKQTGAKDEKGNRNPWNQLLSFCEAQLNRIGSDAGAWYQSSGLGTLLQNEDFVHAEGKGKRCRNTLWWSVPEFGDYGQIGIHNSTAWFNPAEERYVGVLILASECLDEQFQRIVRNATASVGITGDCVAAAPVKTLVRMRGKVGADHRDRNEHPDPRPASNIDTVRCGVVCSKDQLVSAINAVTEAFGGVMVRCKNNYLPSFDARNITFGYRCVMATYVLDAGVTMGQAVSDPKNKTRIEKYVNPKGGDPSYARDALQWMKEGAGKDEPLKLCVEVQFMHTYYKHMREGTHGYYKIARVKGGGNAGNKIMDDYRDGAAGWGANGSMG